MATCEIIRVTQRGCDLLSASLILANKWPQCRSILDTVAQFPDDWFSLEISQARGRLRVKLVPTCAAA